MRSEKQTALKLKNKFSSKKDLLKYLENQISLCDYEEILYWEAIKWEVYIMTNW